MCSEKPPAADICAGWLREGSAKCAHLQKSTPPMPPGASCLMQSAHPYPCMPHDKVWEFDVLQGLNSSPTGGSITISPVRDYVLSDT